MAKLCTKCGVVRPLAEFYKKKSASGYNPWCKPCYREWHRARYAVKGAASDQPRQCNKCGKTYVPAQRKVSFYCSRACKDVERNGRLAQARLESKPDRQCLHCASRLPKSVRADAIFCSANCNEKAHALQRKLRMRTGQDVKTASRVTSERRSAPATSGGAGSARSGSIQPLSTRIRDARAWITLCPYAKAAGTSRPTCGSCTWCATCGGVTSAAGSKSPPSDYQGADP